MNTVAELIYIVISVMTLLTNLAECLGRIEEGLRTVFRAVVTLVPAVHPIYLVRVH